MHADMLNDWGSRLGSLWYLLNSDLSFCPDCHNMLRRWQQHQGVNCRLTDSFHAHSTYYFAIKSTVKFWQNEIYLNLRDWVERKLDSAWKIPINSSMPLCYTWHAIFSRLAAIWRSVIWGRRCAAKCNKQQYEHVDFFWQGHCVLLA